MCAVFGTLLLAVGVSLPAHAALSLARERIWRDRRCVKFALRPGRRLHRAAEPREFWLDVASAAAIAMV